MVGATGLDVLSGPFEFAELDSSPSDPPSLAPAVGVFCTSVVEDPPLLPEPSVEEGRGTVTRELDASLPGFGVGFGAGVEGSGAGGCSFAVGSAMGGGGGGVWGSPGIG